VLAPPGWTGQWDFTIVYRSSETGRVQQVDHVSTDVCPREPLGLALFASASSCQTTSTDSEVSVHCAADLTVGPCTSRGTLQLELQQQGATLAGSGEWMAVNLGVCPLEDVGTGQTIEVSAVRRSTVPVDACAQATSLAQKLVANGAAVLLEDNPFAALTVRDIDVDEGAFDLDGTFTLADTSNGIDPRREAVRLQVGAFSADLPAGAFQVRPTRGRDPAEYTFTGGAGGARLHLKMTRRAERRFDFSAHVERARMGRTPRVVPVALAVGNDAGTVAVRLGRSGRGGRDGNDDDRDHDDHDGDHDHGGQGRRGE